MKKLLYVITALLVVIVLLQMKTSARLLTTDDLCFTLQAAGDWQQNPNSSRTFDLQNDKFNSQILIEWWPRYRWEKANENVETFLVKNGVFDDGQMEELFSVKERQDYPYELVRKEIPVTSPHQYGDFGMAYVVQLYQDYVVLFTLYNSGRELASPPELYELHNMARNFVPGCTPTTNGD